MDCRTALEILEVVRPDSADLADPEVAEAVAHLERHPACKDEFLRRQELDRQIGRVMQDVAVPGGLKDRLLTGLEIGREAADDFESVGGEEVEETGPLGREAGEAAEGALHPSASRDRRARFAFRFPRQRRLWLGGLVASAVAVVAAVLIWRLQPQGPGPVEVAAFRAVLAEELAETDFDELRKFDGRFGAELPSRWTLSVKTNGPRALPRGQTGSHRAALYRFALPGSGARGFLAVLPAEEVAEPPRSSRFAANTGRYVGRFTSVAWSSGELVYICLVPRGAAVDELERLLYRPPA